MPRLPRPSRRLLLVLLIGLADCVLILAYWPSLADSLESSLHLRTAPPTPPPPDQLPDSMRDVAGIRQLDVLPADKAALDDDTPVIGVFAGGRARAYLVEAFERGPESHLVNDVLGGVPISVTHCDISGCTRVFSATSSGQPLDLVMGGRKDSRLLLKFHGQLYRQETSEPLDKGNSAFPYREYPAGVTAWGQWRQAHPETDVYMGAVEEATPPEAGGPRTPSAHKPSSPEHHTS